MSLGVGGATTFNSKNNHATAANHSIRDTSAKDVAACQARAKCPSCGVFGATGSNCKVCKTAIPAPKVKPNWNQKVESLAERQKREAEASEGIKK